MRENVNDREKKIATQRLSTSEKNRELKIYARKAFVKQKFRAPRLSARDMSTPNGTEDTFRLAGGGGGGVEGASSTKLGSSTATTKTKQQTASDLSRKRPDDNICLSDWIEQRQKSFWDFEQSFLQPFGSSSIASTAHFQPPPPLRPIFSRPIFEDVDFFRPQLLYQQQQQQQQPRAMLASREDPNDEMSPKAKVTYDEDKFQVNNFA